MGGEIFPIMQFTPTLPNPSLPTILLSQKSEEPPANLNEVSGNLKSNML